ncbi:MAG: efflux RND transporter periplasmic adaptor subunit [Planctomycetota bacterium]
MGQATGGPPTGGMPPALVKINTIRQERVAPEFRAVGNVRPRFFSVVASGSDGIVEEFPVEVGEYVKAGTILSRLRMESTDLEIAEHEAMLAERQAELEEVREPRKEDRDEAAARKQSADVSYATAERRLKELRALSQRGAANPTEVKDAEEALDAAEQNRLAAAAVLARISTPRPEAVQQAEARMMAQQKHVEFLKAEREKRLTKSPFDGFVVEEHTYLGQWLSKGAAVATIARLDEVEVEVQIDQQYIDQIVPGREVTLRVQGTGSRDGRSRDWPGKVASIVPRTNWQEGSRSFPVIIRMQNEFDTSTNPPTPALREGMMAEAAFLGQQVDGILVPKDAIVRTSRGAFIFVLNSGAGESVPSVRQVLVTQGVSTGEWIQVAGEDLAAGQKVVTEGAERLRAFQTVQILEPSAENAAAKQ